MWRTAIALALVLAAGCAGDGGADGRPAGGPTTPPPPDEDGLTLTLIATSEGPVARLSGGGKIEAAAYTSCWGGQEGAVCVDGFPTTPETFVEAPRGATLRVAGDADTVEAGVARFRPGDTGAELQVVQDLPIEDGMATIDVEPGEYLLQVFATFEQGDGAFALGLSVLPG